jgi:hypothetical protein
MATKVAEMSKQEFSELLEDVVEKKLIELIGESDEGLEMRSGIRKRLLQQRKAVHAGERGRPLEDVISELGLE